SYSETGVLGEAELATAEKGRQAYEEAVRQLVRFVTWWKDRPKDQRKDRHRRKPTMPIPWGQRPHGWPPFPAATRPVRRYVHARAPDLSRVPAIGARAHQPRGPLDLLSQLCQQVPGLPVAAGRRARGPRPRRRRGDLSGRAPPVLRRSRRRGAQL